LKSLPDATRYLKPGIIFEQLDAIASRINDNDATALNKALTTGIIPVHYRCMQAICLMMQW
jgi:hypothetical protein